MIWGLSEVANDDDIIVRWLLVSCACLRFVLDRGGSSTISRLGKETQSLGPKDWALKSRRNIKNPRNKLISKVHVNGSQSGKFTIRKVVG